MTYRIYNFAKNAKNAKMQKILHDDYHLLFIAKLINHYFCNNDFQFFALSIYSAHSIYSDIIHLSNFFTIFIHNLYCWRRKIQFNIFYMIPLKLLCPVKLAN